MSITEAIRKTEEGKEALVLVMAHRGDPTGDLERALRAINAELGSLETRRILTTYSRKG